MPFPANYGGVIDIYNKIISFHEAGIAIVLHCFEYGRSPSPELSKICKKVYYYPRKTFQNFLYGDIPYIVSSRVSDQLLQNLLKDHHPILFEGLHSTYYLKHTLLKHRFKIARTHNVEHDYYHHLELVENNFFKRYFFKLESEKLKKYQSVLKHADLICAISPNDTAYFQKKFGKTLFVPAFHGNTKVEIKEGKGEYILYHGNLTVGENHEAAMYLIKEVFSKLKLPFVIAGSNPKMELKKMVANYDHISLVADVDTNNVNELIANAQINILYTAQATGIKLKLLNALFTGRHCIVNHKMADNTGLEDLCHLANNVDQFIEMVKDLYEIPFSEADNNNRITFFQNRFNNKSTVQNLIDVIVFEPSPEEIAIRRIKKINPKPLTASVNSLLGFLHF